MPLTSFLTCVRRWFAPATDNSLESANVGLHLSAPEPEVAVPRFVLFLDFDGVLHRGTTGTLRHEGALWDVLARYPDVGVVVSSTWRLNETLQGLKDCFSTPLADRIIGVTPELLPGSSSKAARQAEIECWVRANRVTQFVALDDERQLFDGQCPWLLLTDGATGLTEADLRELERRVQEGRPPNR